MNQCPKCGGYNVETLINVDGDKYFYCNTCDYEEEVES